MPRVAAARRLRGLTYCLIGGRSLGIDTTVIDPAQWMKQFGIDVDHVDQFELVRRAGTGAGRAAPRVAPALEYLKKTVGRIHWTAPDATFRLTEELLRRQLGLYYAAIDLIEEFKYDFCGIKGQRELTEHFATADVAEAFLNDPYGPDGSAKPSIVCATEADSDAALTMQIFKHLAGTPVLFADVRHYHADLGVWDLCNSGEHATYFAGRSVDPAVNLPLTEFRPQGFYFPAGGAAVYHIAAPGRVTLARLTRHDGRYVMTVVPAELVDFGAAQPRDRRDQPGQLAARLRALRLHGRDVHRELPLQPHPRRLRRLGRRARAAVRGARASSAGCCADPDRADCRTGAVGPDGKAAGSSKHAFRSPVMSTYVIGLDFGTESVRALLVDVATGEADRHGGRAVRDGVIDERLPVDWASGCRPTGRCRIRPTG